MPTMDIPSSSTEDHATTAKAHPKAMKIGTQALALSESMSPEGCRAEPSGRPGSLRSRDPPQVQGQCMRRVPKYPKYPEAQGTLRN